MLAFLLMSKGQFPFPSNSSYLSFCQLLHSHEFQSDYVLQAISRLPTTFSSELTDLVGEMLRPFTSQDKLGALKKSSTHRPNIGDMLRLVIFHTEKRKLNKLIAGGDMLFEFEEEEKENEEEEEQKEDA